MNAGMKKITEQPRRVYGLVEFINPTKMSIGVFETSENDENGKPCGYVAPTKRRFKWSKLPKGWSWF